ncbi:MAG: phenylalanine--tRNA ligase subunit beta [Patescibacteria group bacterium]
MNLSLSYNWLKEYVATKKDARELAKELSLCGPSIDRVREIKPNFNKVVIGEILKLKKHPDADKLSVCEVGIGEKKPLQIVCGASNIREGQKVPVVLVGGKVGDMEIKPAKLRGIESQGMMCSQKELGLGEDHTGIYILPDYVKVGLLLEKVMPLEDFIFDIEVTSNRPDAMSVIGISREAAAILGDKFLYKEPKPNLSRHPESLGFTRDKLREKKMGLPRSLRSLAMTLKVAIKESKLCHRYQAVVMTDVKVGPSPLWIQQRLLSSGLRPINNLVDITNYILLEFGRPMHVFDYEKLKGGKIIVRSAKKGEKILALDGKNYELNDTNLVIADAKSPVAVAGVMGGELSAATGETKTIVMESANFDPVSVRRTARTLNLHSESSDLYEKGLSPEGTYPAILRAIELVMEIAEGKVASEIFDEKPVKYKAKKIDFKIENISRVLGVEIKSEKAKEILERLGFEVSEKGKTMSAVVPWWRDGDMEGEHDIIEEVARIYGYHNLPSKLMIGEIPINFETSREFYFEDKAKNTFAALGYAENYNYSFISEKLIKDCGQNPKDHLKVANPLSADFEYMRTSLAPGILQSAAENESFAKTFKIFELSKVYLPKDNDLPIEKTNLIAAAIGYQNSDGFYELKSDLISLVNTLNIKKVEFAPTDALNWWQKNKTVAIKIGDEIIGALGFINSDTSHLFGFKKSIALFELDFEKLIHYAKTSPSYRPIPKFPGIELDLSMEIGRDALYQDIIKSISGLDNLIESISFLSVFEDDLKSSDGASKLPEGKKALAIRLTYRDNKKTLKLEEAQKIHNKVVVKLKKEYNIKVR